MSPRLVAIVMHGSGRYYLEPLLARGRLPNLQRLVHDGHSRYFHSELPLAAGAWVTILTGLSVGEHGVIDYVDLDARSYDGLAGRYADAGSYHAHTIQTVLSDAGLRVASVFLPMTSPPWPVNGMIISGFPLPDETRPPTYPPDLAARLPRYSDRRLLLLRYDEPDAIDGAVHDDPEWRDELSVESHAGVEYYAWGEELTPAFDRVSPARPLGIGGRLFVAGDLVVRSNADDAIRASIDATKGGSLADDEGVRALVGALDTAGASTIRGRRQAKVARPTPARDIAKNVSRVVRPIAVYRNPAGGTAQLTPGSLVGDRRTGA